MKKPILSRETYEQTMEVIRIGNRAVQQAQEENHRLGLPNIFWRNGKIVYEMPNGEIVVKENPHSNEKQKS